MSDCSRESFVPGEGGSMTHRHIFVLLLSGTLACGSASRGGIRAHATDPLWESHHAWVTEALVRIQTIKPGMTRSDLLKVFTTEGGIQQYLHRTFVSRDCPYFKVDVEFEAVGRPSRDSAGRVLPIEDGRDIIVRISRPYLEFSIID
jgi:hypothetical protein